MVTEHMEKQMPAAARNISPDAPRAPYTHWTVSFQDRKGNEVAESREVFLRHGQHYKFIHRLGDKLEKNERGIKWINVESDSFGCSRRVGR